MIGLNKDKITFTHNKCELLLNISSKNFDSIVVKSFADKHGLIPKDEYHITLVGGKASLNILKRLKTLSIDEQFSMREKIVSLANNVNWEIIFQNRFSYLQKNYNDLISQDSTERMSEIRETIIQFVNVPQLQEFYISLKNLLKIEEKIESLPHVTIFSNSSRNDKKQHGIGIYSNKDLLDANAKEIDLL